VRSWGQKNGLPQDWVSALAKGPDGYLWVGSEEGLARFDGSVFRVFTRANSPGMDSHLIETLLFSRDNTLWIGTYGGGLLHFTDGKFRAYGTNDNFIGRRANSMAEGPDGTLWVATSAGIHKLVGGKVEALIPKGLMTESDVRALWVDRRGDLWVGTGESGLMRLRGSERSVFTVKDGLPSATVMALREDDAGVLWIGTAAGLACLKDGRIVSLAASTQTTDTLIWALSPARAGGLWIGTSDGLRRIGPAGVEVLRVKDGLPGVSVHAICEANEGLWLGTATGLVWLKDSTLTPLDVRRGALPAAPNTIVPAREGGFWLGGVDGEVCRLRDGGVTCLGLRSRLHGSEVKAFCEARDGSLWIGTWLGVFRLAHGRLEDWTERFALPTRSVRAILEDRDGGMWVGSESSGLSVLRHGTLTRYTTQNGLAGDQVRAILEDRGGRLWVATYGGLSCVHDTVVRSWTVADGLPSDFVRSLHEDADGVLWVGTYGGGIGRLKQGTITAFTSREGLPNDVAYAILEDDVGMLWVSCNQGVYRVAKRELNDVAEHRAKTVHSRAFTEVDGLPSRSSRGNFQSGCRGPDGRLWFATLEGLACVDPSRVVTRVAAPPLVIESIAVDGQEVELKGGAQVPAGSRRFEVNYVALDFESPENVCYRYRLRGYDDNWVEVGGRRTAVFTGVGPGVYRFEVAARRVDGFWTEPAVVTELRVMPFFYQRGWFLGACGLLVVGLLYGAYRLRVQGLAARERELRARIDEAVGRVEVLSGLLPICSYCHKIRNDSDYWQSVDAYITEHSQARFTHGICPECMEARLRPQIEKLRRSKADRSAPGTPSRSL